MKNQKIFLMLNNELYKVHFKGLNLAEGQSIFVSTLVEISLLFI